MSFQIEQKSFIMIRPKFRHCSTIHIYRTPNLLLFTNFLRNKWIQYAIVIALRERTRKISNKTDKNE